MKTWKNVCPQGELKLELSEGMEILAEMPLVEKSDQSGFDRWCEDGAGAVFFDGEIYMKMSLDGSSDTELLAIDEVNSRINSA